MPQGGDARLVAGLGAAAAYIARERALREREEHAVDHARVHGRVAREAREVLVPARGPRGERERRGERESERAV